MVDLNYLKKILALGGSLVKGLKSNQIISQLANNKFISQLLFKSSGGPSILNHNPFITFRRFYSKNPDFTPLSEKSYIKLNLSELQDL